MVMRSYLFLAIAGLACLVVGCSSSGDYHARRAFLESRSAKKLKASAEGSMENVRNTYAIIDSRLTKAEARANALDRP